MSLLDIDGGLAPQKRARVGRPHDDILGPIERDVADSGAGRGSRELLLDAGVPSRSGEPLADTLRAQAKQLDAHFTEDPSAATAAVLEACVAAPARPSRGPLPRTPPHARTHTPHDCSCAGSRTCRRTRPSWRVSSRCAAAAAAR